MCGCGQQVADRTLGSARVTGERVASADDAHDVQSCERASHAALRMWHGVPSCVQPCAHVEEAMADDGQLSSG